jgi:hypothetical protein
MQASAISARPLCCAAAAPPRCTGPPFVPSTEHRAKCPACLPPLALVLVCVGAVAAGVLSGCLVRICGSTPSYKQRPRASWLCHWGDRLLCSASRRCALGQTRPGLAVWRFGGPRGSGAAKTAGSAPFLAAARRRLGGAGGGRKRLTGFDPPWLLFVQTQCHVSTQSFEHLRPRAFDQRFSRNKYLAVINMKRGHRSGGGSTPRRARQQMAPPTSPSEARGKAAVCRRKYADLVAVPRKMNSAAEVNN